jgi:ribosomal protein S18 acetylase RimI-like enzyme
MQAFSPTGSTIRPMQHRDLEAIEQLQLTGDLGGASLESTQYKRSARNWFPLVPLVSWFPNPIQHLCRIYVAEANGQVVGFIRVSPFNSSRSTWQIDEIEVAQGSSRAAIGTHLIRYCLEACWEARTWLLEVDVNAKDAIALYRQNGFQPLAQLTDWEISAEGLTGLAQHQPDLPNLLPVSNADAILLYQLDTAALPPQIRQVYDISVNDFRCSLVDRLISHSQYMLNNTQEVSGYVYEPQRKAAIAYFSVLVHHPVSKHQTKQSAQPAHRAQVTVHPAYTWLYAELMAQIARIIQQQVGSSDRYSLWVSSADYQPEREAYFEQIQAATRSHGLLMARSVWHKIREAKPALDALQLSKMLSGFQPAQKPVPGRIDTIPPAHPDELS